jgi:hypothetical protein
VPAAAGFPRGCKPQQTSTEAQTGVAHVDVEKARGSIRVDPKAAEFGGVAEWLKAQKRALRAS